MALLTTAMALSLAVMGAATPSPRHGVVSRQTQQQSSPSQAPPPPPPRPLSSPLNPLKGLPELPKYHYLCEGIATPYVLDPTANDGIIVDYAHITGSISADVANATIAQAAVAVCAKAQAASNLSDTKALEQLTRMIKDGACILGIYKDLYDFILIFYVFSQNT